MSKSKRQFHPLSRQGKKRGFAKPWWCHRKHKPFGAKRSGIFGGECYFPGQKGRYGRRLLHGEIICYVINKKKERRDAKSNIINELNEII